MKTLILNVFFSSIMLMLPLAYADEHDTEDILQPGAEDKQTTTAPDAEKRDESTNAFIPTETISEDLSVPFPVDI